LWRRPGLKLGCGAKERRKKNRIHRSIHQSFNCLICENKAASQNSFIGTPSRDISYPFTPCELHDDIRGGEAS